MWNVQKLDLNFGRIYLRGLQGYDVMEELYSHRNSAVSFVEDLCKTRPKASLSVCISFIIQAMDSYKCAPCSAGSAACSVLRTHASSPSEGNSLQGSEKWLREQPKQRCSA